MLNMYEVKEVLAKIIAENPDNVNPIDSNSMRCVYNTVDSLGYTKRCIVGQMGHELGWPDPLPDAGSASELFDECIEFDEEENPWRGFVDQDSAYYLDHIQRKADNVRSGEANPRLWKDIVL